MKKQTLAAAALLTALYSPFMTVKANAEPSSGGVSSLLAAVAKKNGTPVYTSPDSASSLKETLSSGEEYPIKGMVPGYYQIGLLAGQTGYVPKSDAKVKPVSRFVLGWNAFGKTDTFLRQNSVSQNLSVVSPRWFFLQKGSDPVQKLTNTRYVNASHDQGKKVWPMFGNHFDEQLTADFLSNPEKRQKAVEEVKAALVETGADGINIDFENMSTKSKADFVTFISELHAALQPAGKMVSVDVMRTNGDPNWSGSYDRYALGKAADFVILMAYEEHWAGSGMPGSVGSLPWVNEGIRLLLQEIPAHKVVLGVPFFTRDWVTDQVKGTVTDADLTLTEMQNVLSSQKPEIKWDASTQQNYAEYTQESKKHQIWLEDAASMRERKDLILKYGLAGAAGWYVGEETKDIWPVFDGFPYGGTNQAAADFTDISGHWAKTDIAQLYRQGVIQGTSPKTFDPERPITRAELVNMLARCILGGNPPAANNPSFSDIRPSDWYTSGIQLLQGLEIVSGYPDGTFQPNRLVTREEMAQLLMKAQQILGDSPQLSEIERGSILKTYSDGPLLTWSRSAVAAAVQTGLLQGKSGQTLDPQGTATRAETAAMVNRLAKWLDNHR